MRYTQWGRNSCEQSRKTGSEWAGIRNGYFLRPFPSGGGSLPRGLVSISPGLVISLLRAVKTTGFCLASRQKGPCWGKTIRISFTDPVSYFQAYLGKKNRLVTDS
uniref:Uncharacterized protein n=1 Tax=Phlegmariurus squarrosus TaxID=73615 RepID=H9M8C4_PHLSQ|nr:hypothetical protein HusqMp91 [Phlegmariurus squarrosus]AEV55831.1 hypothetical protein HusqMp91 [Phlegmariurus squarrosus]